jgi:hypothetical protein
MVKLKKVIEETSKQIEISLKSQAISFYKHCNDISVVFLYSVH